MGLLNWFYKKELIYYQLCNTQPANAFTLGYDLKWNITIFGNSKTKTEVKVIQTHEIHKHTAQWDKLMK